MTDHLTRWASVTFLLAALFCVVSGLIASPAGRGANIEQHPPGDSARALEALTVAQSQGGDGSCFGASATSARSKDPRPATSGKTRFSREYASATPAGTARTTAPATNLLERETRALPTDLHDLRVAKCRRLWATFAPWSYDPDLCAFFVAEHERVGLADQWMHSLAYSLVNCGLMTDGSDYHGAYAPCDQRWRNGFASSCRVACADLLDGRAWREELLRSPRVNIRCHVEELVYWHDRTGRVGYPLLRKVFLPANPDGSLSRGWGSRWPKVMAKFAASITDGYRVGKL